MMRTDHENAPIPDAGWCSHWGYWVQVRLSPEEVYTIRVTPERDRDGENGPTRKVAGAHWHETTFGARGTWEQMLDKLDEREAALVRPHREAVLRVLRPPTGGKR